jgi:hypothetical protein
LAKTIIIIATIFIIGVDHSGTTILYWMLRIIPLSAGFRNFLCAEARSGGDPLVVENKKAYSLGISKNKQAQAMSQTEKEHAYGRKYTIFQPNGRSLRT